MSWTAIRDLILDRAASLSPIERMKLVTEYGRIRNTLTSGKASMMDRMRAIMRANEIRATLGAEVEPKPKELPFLATLREVLSGTHDALGLDSLLAKIDTAITGLNTAGALKDEAESLADQAITHWAELEASDVEV